MIYLNNATTSFPKPASVLVGVGEYLSHSPETPGRGGVLSNADILDRCKRRMSDYISAPTQSNIFFFLNATQAINQVIYGMNWKKGDHVITTVVEHNSVLRPLQPLKALGVDITLVECDQYGAVNPDNVLEQLTDHTRMVIISHVSNVTGAVQDIHCIGKALANHSACFVVDAAQSLGLYPIDVERFNIDILAFTGHKFLYSIQGVGGLYINPKIQLEPLILGGTGALSESLEHPKILPWRYQAGTLNMPGIVSLLYGVEYISSQKFVLEKIREKVSILRQSAVDTGALCHSPEDSTLLTISYPKQDTEELCMILKESFDIHIRGGLHCAPLIQKYIGAPPEGTLRFSPSFLTCNQDIERAASALSKLTCLVAWQ